MNIWYQVVIKSNKEVDNGMLKQVSESFLFDAVSYTEAESRAYKWAENNIQGEFALLKVTKTNIAEVVAEEAFDDWFKCKIVYSTLDGDSNKEVKINTFLLVSAESVKQAYDIVEKHLSSMLVPFSIPSITQTNIIEVLAYIPDLNEE